MSSSTPAASNVREVDLRPIPRPQRHARVYDEYALLTVGDELRLINDHEPKRLRDELERDFAGSFDWASSTPHDDDAYRVRLTKLSSTPLPRHLTSRAALSEVDADASGSIWRLEPSQRDLDANVIALPPGGGITRHNGPSLDVLLHVLDGSGTLETELDEVALAPGDIVWLPRGSERRFLAGPDGIRYLTVHHRKPLLNITTAP